ncbi:unknown [Prevotella sp. CAG:891]|nr:unknown [Prevotella sp. CAG:891]
MGKRTKKQGAIICAYSENAYFQCFCFLPLLHSICFKRKIKVQ